MIPQDDYPGFTFPRRHHQPRRPPLANSRPGRGRCLHHALVPAILDHARAVGRHGAMNPAGKVRCNMRT